MPGELERGRECYAQRKWADAYDSLSRADQAMTLGGKDLELLAMAAYLIGRDEDRSACARARTSGVSGRWRRRASCPLRVLAWSASSLSRRDGTRDWVARPCPAVAGTRDARMRRAGLSVVAGRGAAACRRRLRGCIRERSERRRNRGTLRRRRLDCLRPAPAGSDSIAAGAG